jgi:hypothetical protein
MIHTFMFGAIIIYFYGNGFLVKDNDMTKRAITLSFFFSFFFLKKKRAITDSTVCLFTTYIRNRNRCIEFYIEGKKTRTANSTIMDTNY